MQELINEMLERGLIDIVYTASVLGKHKLWLQLKELQDTITLVKADNLANILRLNGRN